MKIVVTLLLSEHQGLCSYSSDPHRFLSKNLRASYSLTRNPRKSGSRDAIVLGCGDAYFLNPIYNDWESATVAKPDAVVESNRLDASVLLVNDASTQPLPPEFPGATCQPYGVWKFSISAAMSSISAVAVGVVHLSQTPPDEAVLVMDGDGEDRPALRRSL